MNVDFQANTVHEEFLPLAAAKVLQNEIMLQAATELAVFQRCHNRGHKKRFGISTYELTRALPRQLQSALPTVQEIERETAAQGEGAKEEATQRADATKVDAGIVADLKELGYG